jgi:cytochrome b involved in lipid metabolism
MKFHEENKNLRGFEGPPKRAISLAELRMHCTEEDCWMAYMGKVYNVTSYLDYHPGGIPEIMRAAGSDATVLFDQIHKWVNFASMLANNYVGELAESSEHKSAQFLMPAPAPSPSVSASVNFLMGRVEHVLPHTASSYIIRIILGATIEIPIGISIIFFQNMKMFVCRWPRAD